MVAGILDVDPLQGLLFYCIWAGIVVQGKAGGIWLFNPHAGWLTGSIWSFAAICGQFLEIERLQIPSCLSLVSASGGGLHARIPYLTAALSALLLPTCV